MSRKIVIIYATQTGQAKAIAETINDEAVQNGFEPKLYNIEKYDKEFKLNELTDPVIFVCSTTGDGETPESARKCYSRLKKLDTLKNLNYALLGLGDTNYTQFCNGPKLFHNRFLELGAKCFYGPFWADDAVGLENEVEPFKEGLWQELDDYFKKEDSLCLEMNKLSIKNESLGSELTLPELVEPNLEIKYLNLENLLVEKEKIFSSMHPQSNSGIFKAIITENKILTKKNSEKDCFSIKFRLNEVFAYEPGYSIDVICPNNKIEVEKLLQRLGVLEFKEKRILLSAKDSSKKLGQSYVKLTEDNSLSLEFFFSYCVDIRTNGLKKNVLRMLSEYCQKDEEKIRLWQLCSREGAEEYQNLIKENLLSLLDLLNIFKSCKPPVEHLIQILPSLNVRSYSLCSSDSNDQMEFIFNLVKFKLKNNRTYERNGIGTDYLSSLKENEIFYFMKRKFQNFSFPLDDLAKPVIMIGPGTGIAPFISFLRHKIALNQSLSNLWLFYGCRDPEKDFLFKDEIINVYSKSLAKFSISFSRFTYDPNDKSKEETELISFIDKHHLPNSKYVQDSIKFYSKEIVDLINEKEGFIYVCGDAKNMSKDVFNCFVECLVKELNISTESANKYLMEMIKTKRYKQDIWA